MVYVLIVAAEAIFWMGVRVHHEIMVKTKILDSTLLGASKMLHYENKYFSPIFAAVDWDLDAPPKA